MMIAAVQEALSLSGLAPREVLAVFATQHGELTTSVNLLDSMVNSNTVSPARFAQSVHNTAVGIFSIAAGNVLPSTTIVSDFPWEDAVLEAASLVATQGRPVLVACGDDTIPTVLGSSQVAQPAAIATVLGPANCAGRGFLRVCPSERKPQPACKRDGQTVAHAQAVFALAALERHEKASLVTTSGIPLELLPQ